MLNTDSAPTRRVVNAPPATARASTAPARNLVLSVVLEADEDVEWIWTATADGAEYVSGYNIVKNEHAGSAGHQP